jgi:hypothetical protein
MMHSLEPFDVTCSRDLRWMLSPCLLVLKMLVDVFNLEQTWQTRKFGCKSFLNRISMGVQSPSANGGLVESNTSIQNQQQLHDLNTNCHNGPWKYRDLPIAIRRCDKW